MLSHTTYLDSLIREKLKVDDTEVNVRVEVDKYVYDSTLTTEIETIVLEQITPISVPVQNKSKMNVTNSTRLILPIKGLDIETLPKKITSPFGERIHPIYGVKQFHEGIDLGYPEGTTVVAAADGIVVEAGIIQGINQVWIKHVNGYLTKYLHVVPKVKKGQYVVQNEPIATVGAKDSFSTGAHLHFGLYKYDSKQGYVAVDPVPYLLDKVTLDSDTKRKEVLTNVYGVVIAISGLNIRKGPSTKYSVIGTMPYKARCQILEKYYDSEWYKIKYGSVEGYAYSHYIQIEGSGGTVSSTTRPGGNPSYVEIYNYIKEVCNRIGLPAEIGWAIAWTESKWTQFKSDGTPFSSNNETSKDWGIMQINEDAHPDAFPQAKTDWKYNVEYGLKYALVKYNKAKTMYSDRTAIARATYSAYNTGSNFSRWESESDKRDTNFYNAYISKPWNQFLSIGGEGDYGVVIKSNALIREAPSFDSDVILIGKKGLILEYSGYTSPWYRILLPDGRTGYIYEKDFRRDTTHLLVEYKVDKIYFDNFSQYAQNKLPSGYLQNKNEWKVYVDNSVNCLRIAGGGKEQSYFSFNVNITYTGRLDLEYMINLAEGNYFKVYVNDKVYFIDGNRASEDYEGISIPLLTGVNVIKIERDKTVDGADEIKVRTITVYEYVAISEDDSDLADMDIDTQTMHSLVVIAQEGVDIFSEKSKDSSVLLHADKGQSFYCKNVSIYDWVEIVLEDGTIGYVYYDPKLVNVRNDNIILTKFTVFTGGFKYERTITLKGVISINIDRRSDMRTAEAQIVLDNSDGRYTPDAKIYNFQYKGIGKSDVIEYEGGKPYSVLSENTPIRVYIGYGNVLQRVFTGLIDAIDVDGENGTITLRCSDMMKKLNECYLYKPVSYPPDGNKYVAWLVSAVIHDLVNKAGLTGWRVREEDLKYPDVIIEDTYYTDLKPNSNWVTKFDEYGQPKIIKYESVVDKDGYRNPFVFNNTFPEGTNVAEAIDELCQYINYWQRCDEFGTYWCTPIQIDSVPVAYFKDGETLISLNMTIDTTRVKNHLIVAGSNGEDHFFDKELWRWLKGERRSAKISVPWADTYGKRRVVAQKLFDDMKRLSRTLSVAIVGNPYIQLFDTVMIQHSKTMIYDKYYVKGIRHSYSPEAGFITYLDLFWLDK